MSIRKNITLSKIDMIHILSLVIMLVAIFNYILTDTSIFKTALIILSVEFMKKLFNDVIECLKDYPEYVDDPDVSVSNIFSR